ncbi:hypothetical protein CBR_g28564 [Chara braunii]|uniref:Reverse transcriptase domain-containing protein n=1 Tax=Chara braunii TaxID=69332 RepID=A0A388JWD7_CHABU|nr:hypothetical protein CBR_g28564 [Chara braunii]|eukprot:GBG62088.1 hypothetical protein CBR_g28564 [Chara braunii]
MKETLLKRQVAILKTVPSPTEEQCGEQLQSILTTLVQVRNLEDHTSQIVEVFAKLQTLQDDLTDMTRKYHELTREVAELRQAQVANPLPLPLGSEAAIETTSASLTVSSSLNVLATPSGPATSANSAVAVTSSEAENSATGAAPRLEPAGAGPSNAGPYVDRKAVQIPSKYDSKEDIESWISSTTAYFEILGTQPENQSVIMGMNVEPAVGGFLEVQPTRAGIPKIQLTRWLKATPVASLEKLLISQYLDPHAASRAIIQLDKIKRSKWAGSMKNLQTYLSKMFATPGLELTAQSCLDVVKGAVPTNFTNRVGRDFIGYTDWFTLMKDIVSLEDVNLVTTAGSKKPMGDKRFKGSNRLAVHDLLEAEEDADADDPTLGDDQEQDSDTACGCKVFSKIDLKSGYHQIEVDPANQQKTAFKTRDGLYEFTVMPFGLTNAPTTFQSLMDKVLREQIGRFVVVDLDDILILSKPMKEHLKHLEEVLTILKKTQLHLNLEKSEFGKDSVIYLGHRLSAAGLKPEATKVEVVRNWPQPVNICELRSFLGLASYYRKFVPRFSIVARPLSRLTSKNVPYSWDTTCTNVFQALKDALKGGKLRMSIDYRDLNRITRKNAYPLPRIDDLLDAAGGCKVFSKIDLKSGYHQIEVDPANQQKTAFKTRDGLYEFTVMPFGLTNAPTTFQSLMDKVLREQIGRFVVVDLDDILILSKPMKEHLKHLEEVLTILKKTQLHLNLEKSEFGKDSVIYLGHRLSAAGLKPEATKVEVVRNWPQPVNICELRSFLGLASYYRKFVPRFSIVARPLSRLTSKNVPYSWDTTCTNVFQALKDALVSYPVLRIADPKQTFVVTTDASQYGIDAVLEQDDDDGLRPLEYYSKRMPSVNVTDSARARSLVYLLLFQLHPVFGLAPFFQTPPLVP